MVDKRYADGDQGYEFCLVGGQLYCDLIDSTSGGDLGAGPAGPDLRDGRFHHVALTVQRDSTEGGALYADGQPVLTFDPTSQAGDLSNTGPLRIGYHVNSSLHCNFFGQMDEVSLYNRALALSEIQAIYNAGPAGKFFDSDTNGLPDNWEQYYFGHIGVNPNEDSDGDGYTNLQSTKTARIHSRPISP